jgi:hypothetical protein
VKRTKNQGVAIHPPGDVSVAQLRRGSQLMSLNPILASASSRSETFSTDGEYITGLTLCQAWIYDHFLLLCLLLAERDISDTTIVYHRFDITSNDVLALCRASAPTFKIVTTAM